MDSFFSEDELKEIGFKSIGKNVRISRFARIYGASEMSIGDYVRIDDFVVLSGKLKIGKYVHIAVYCALFGGKTGIELYDYSGMSSRCVIYAESDDYSGEYLTNPTIDEEFRGCFAGKVELRKHVILGAGTTVFPGVTIGEGTAIGSMSLVNKSLGEWGIYAGIPCKLKKERSKNILNQEKNFEKKVNNNKI